MTRIEMFLRDELPCERIVEALRGWLLTDASPVEIDGVMLDVSASTPLEVIARSLHAYEIDIGFGAHFKAIVAVGGVARVEHGIPIPVHFFSTLFFTPEGNVIAVDCSLKLP